MPRVHEGPEKVGQCRLVVYTDANEVRRRDGLLWATPDSRFPDQLFAIRAIEQDIAWI